MTIYDTNVVYPNSAGEVEVPASYGWSDHNNIKVNDQNSAYANGVDTEKNMHTDYLRAYNFGFTIPEDAEIYAVKAGKGMRSEGANNWRDWGIRLYVDSTVTGTNQAVATTYPTSWGTQGYAPGNTWGVSLSPAQVNSSQFSVLVSCEHHAGDYYSVHINYIYCRIYYARAYTNLTKINGIADNSINYVQGKAIIFTDKIQGIT